MIFLIIKMKNDMNSGIMRFIKGKVGMFNQDLTRESLCMEGF